MIIFGRLYHMHSMNGQFFWRLLQPIKTSQPTIAQKTDNRIEELTKLKDLLDAGVITQEEFDAKKKQILEM